MGEVKVKISPQSRPHIVGNRDGYYSGVIREKITELGRNGGATVIGRPTIEEPEHPGGGDRFFVLSIEGTLNAAQINFIDKTNEELGFPEVPCIQVEFARSVIFHDQQDENVRHAQAFVPMFNELGGAQIIGEPVIVPPKTMQDPGHATFETEGELSQPQNLVLMQMQNGRGLGGDSGPV